MTLETIVVYVATSILEHIIQEEIWYKRIWLRINPPQKYKDRLVKCINETIQDYEKTNPIKKYPGNKFPFYHSQILFELLCKYMLYEKDDTTLITESFEKNPYIIKPSAEELSRFYNLFLEKVYSDSVLTSKFVEENYQKKIFSNASKLDVVINKLDDIKKDTKKIIQIIGSPQQRDHSKELTAQIPLLFNINIIERESDLEDVHERLMKNAQGVLVKGMGGIGKTTLVQMYITRYYQVYKHLVWINISVGDFITDFIQTPGLIESMKINPEGKTSKEIFDGLIIALKNLKHEYNEQSLIIIDNAEESILQYQNYFPHPPQWHVLATSRHRLDEFDVKDLDFLDEQQSIALFKLHYSRKNISDNEIGKIVKELEYHTLTIEILAKTAQNDGLDIQKTLNTIAENYSVEVNTRHGGKIEKITSYLSSIFDLSKLSDDERWLLKQFYYLPPQYISCQTIDSILLPGVDQQQTNIQKTLSRLTAKGWLLYNQTTAEYKLHRIISDVIKHSVVISFDDILPLIQTLSSLLSIDYTKDNPIDKFQWVVFGKHLLMQISFTDENEINILQNNLALVLQDLGDYQGAKELLEKAKISAEKNFGPEHPTTAVRYSNLALVLKALGDYQGAKELLEKAKISAEKNFGPEHPTTAVRYSNLATVLQDLGDYQGAKELLEKAKISDEKNFGPEHPNTAVRYSNLALVLKALGDYQGAKELLEKAKISAEKNFGPEHPTTAVRYSNLATVLQDLGDYQGAKELLEKAKISAEKNFGPEHPTTAVSYSNLALVLKALGDYQGAKELLEKAKISAEKNFGPEHPTTAVRYSNLALVLKALGDYQGAKELLEKAKISNEKNFGPEHPTTAVRYSNLALVLKALGDYQGAKELLEKAKISAEKNFGPEHPTTAVRYSNLATVLQDLGDYQGAKELLEKAKISDEKNFGPEHPTTAVRYSNLALVLKALGDYQGAKELLEKAKISNEKNFGPEHPTTAVSYSNLGMVLQALGDYQGAKELLEKAKISDEKNFGPEHPTTAVSYSNLALVLQDLGDYQGAKELLEKAKISDEKNFGPEHPTTAVSYSNLALVLQALGDYQGAKELLEKAKISDEKNFGPEHPTTAVSYSNLALVLQDLGDYQGAKELFEKAKNVFEQTLGSEHPNTLTIKSNLNFIIEIMKNKNSL